MEQSATTVYRKATPDDKEDIIQLMIDLSGELPIEHVDHDIIRTNTENLYSLPNVEAYVAELDGKVIGGIGFILGNELWSSRVIAYEAFWYVKPDYRGKTGLKLLKYVEKQLDCDILDLGVYNPRLRQLLLKSGYRYEKAIMSKEL